MQIRVPKSLHCCDEGSNCMFFLQHHYTCIPGSMGKVNVSPADMGKHPPPLPRLTGTLPTERLEHDSEAMNLAAHSSLHTIILHSSAEHPHHHHAPLLTPHFHLLCTVWISITSSSFLLACLPSFSTYISIFCNPPHLIHRWFLWPSSRRDSVSAPSALTLCCHDSSGASGPARGIMHSFRVPNVLRFGAAEPAFPYVLC